MARLDAAYELKGQRMECSVSLRNTSETAMEFNVRPLGLKTLLDYWNCQGESFGAAWGYSNVEVYVFRRYLYEALTKLTGQQHAVWPDYEGWKKWLAEQKEGNHSQADRK